MNVCLDGAHGTLDDQLDAHRRRQVKDDVALIDQLSRDRPVVNAVNSVVKAWVIFQMLNISEAAGRKIVDDENFVAAPEVRVGKMRSDETRPARDQNSQTPYPLSNDCVKREA